MAEAKPGSSCSSATDPTRIRQIEKEIADLKKSWPPHSVPVSMWQRLEALEDALEKAMAGGTDGQ